MFAENKNGLFPSGRGEGTGYFLSRVAKPRVKEIWFLHESRKAHSISPRHGLAGVVEQWFLPREAKPRVVGIIVSPQLLNHKWGNGMRLEWRVEKSPSLPLFLKGMSLYDWKWKLKPCYKKLESEKIENKKTEKKVFLNIAIQSGTLRKKVFEYCYTKQHTVRAIAVHTYVLHKAATHKNLGSGHIVNSKERS